MNNLARPVLFCAAILVLVACGGVPDPSSVAMHGVTLTATVNSTPLSTAPPPAPTFTPVPTIDASATPRVPPDAIGRSISGSVFYGSTPVPEARVQLRSFDASLEKWVPILETVSDRNGNFVLVNPPSGDYSIGGLFPDDTEGRFAGEAITVKPGTSVSGLRVVLTRPLALLRPAPNASVSALPTLEWSSFPDARSFRLIIIQDGTTELVFDRLTGETSATLENALQPGETYTWTVNALAANGASLASSSNRFTVAAAGAGAAAAKAAGPLPPACQAEGMQEVATYVNGDDNYCYRYPARFRSQEIEPGKMGVVGPALDKSAEPIFARLTVTVTEIHPDSDLLQLVDEALREYAGMNVGPIAQSGMNIGGDKALVAEPIPGYLSSRAVFVQHGNRLYRLDFWPVQVSIAKADLDELFQQVTTSFSFLD